MLPPQTHIHDDNLMTTADLLASGYDDRAITRLVARGVLHRIRHGAYTFAIHWHQLDEVGRHLLTARAVLRNVKAPTLLCGPTAARALGAPTWDLGDEVHVVRPDQRSDRRRAGRAPHRGRLLVGDVTVRHGLPVTSGTKTALDVITQTDQEHALVVVDGLLHTKETTLPLLEQRSRAMDHDPGSLIFPIILGLTDGRHESAGETRSAAMFRAHQLPRPEPQYEIRDRYGHVVARVDFAWPELGVFVEFDGKVKYGRLRRPGESVEEAVLREKKREELVCGLTGWRCVRITWADLYRPELVIARICASFRGEPWPA